MRSPALLAALVLVLVAIAVPASAKADKTWVCHATGSETNSWVVINVANQGWMNGHKPATTPGSNNHGAQLDNMDSYVGSDPLVVTGPSPKWDTQSVCGGGEGDGGFG